MTKLMEPTFQQKAQEAPRPPVPDIPGTGLYEPWNDLPDPGIEELEAQAEAEAKEREKMKRETGRVIGAIVTHLNAFVAEKAPELAYTATEARTLTRLIVDVWVKYYANAAVKWAEELILLVFLLSTMAPKFVKFQENRRAEALSLMPEEKANAKDNSNSARKSRKRENAPNPKRSTPRVPKGDG